MWSFDTTADRFDLNGAKDILNGDRMDTNVTNLIWVGYDWLFDLATNVKVGYKCHDGLLI